jgi:hypothetical protein
MNDLTPGLAMALDFHHLGYRVLAVLNADESAFALHLGGLTRPAIASLANQYAAPAVFTTVSIPDGADYDRFDLHMGGGWRVFGVVSP